MSSISMIGVTGFAPFGQLVANAEATHTRLNNLTNQASTGLIANNYAGLGSGASVSSTCVRSSTICRPGRTTWMR